MNFKGIGEEAAWAGLNLIAELIELWEFDAR